ncbi:MAG: carbohydrate ABC transporter permease [Bacilli bacterium]|jgi:putative aldouronate transport system permease protein|nr:carbohydrate ABC transporter permease [Bacilli bacterium]
MDKEKKAPSPLERESEKEEKIPTLQRLPLRPHGVVSNQRFGALDVIIFLILLIYVIAVIFPFYNAFVISISSEHAYNNVDLLLWPQEITFEAYQTVFRSQQLWNGFGITMILLVFGTAYQLFFTVITGYAMSRDKWFGKNFVMNLILVTMFFGGGLVPYYYLIISLGLYNTIWVMIIPGAIDTFNMLLMRNYFASLPKELEESAKMDGANDVQIFVKVYLPLSLPMLATVGLFFAVGNWNSWYNGMLFIENSSLKPLQLVLREMIASIASNVESPTSKTYSEGLVMASIFFTIVPMMCFYPFLQKFFVKGIVVGAIKG